MKKSERSLFEKQNDDILLTIQACAKYHYEKASTQCMLRNIMLMIPTALGVIYENIAVTLLSFVIDVIFILTDNQADNNQKKANELRNLFDDMLFNINNHDFKDDNYKKIISSIDDKPIVQKYKQNTGEEKPPGVKNWYSSSNEKELSKQIIHCQKENMFFNENIFEIYLCLLNIRIVIAIIMIIFIVWLLICTLDRGLFQGVLSVLPFLKLLIEKFKKRVRIKDVIIENNILKESIHITESEGIDKLILRNQKHIHAIRECNIKIPNFIHKVYSKKLHNKKRRYDSYGKKGEYNDRKNSLW